MTKHEAQLWLNTTAANDLFAQSQRVLDDAALLLLSSERAIAASKAQVARFSTQTVTA